MGHVMSFGIGIVMDDDRGSGEGRHFSGCVRAVIRHNVDIVEVLGVILIPSQSLDGIADDLFLVASRNDNGDSAFLETRLEGFWFQPDE